VRLKSGKVGIFETKHESDPGGSVETKAKAEALQEWRNNQKRKDIIGGIVIEHNGQWLLHDGKKYDWEKCERNIWSDWRKLEF